MKGYEKLDDVLARAYKQASEGKGKERHANDLPFHEQPMQQVNGMVGVGFSNGQAIKKIIESQNIAPEKAVHELLGAICYLAGSIITIEAANDNAEPHPDIKNETFEYLNPNTWELHTVTANQAISGDWIKVPEGAELFINNFFWRGNESRHWKSKSDKWNSPENGHITLKQFRENYPNRKTLWSRNPLPLTRDEAREILANMRRGSVANINDHSIEFTEHGCFDVKRGNHGSHFSRSLKQTLNYIFQDSK